METFAALTDDELVARISAAKARLGDSVCILAHHYQGDQIVRFADFVGDSLKLSQQAAARKDARHIVFCGVDFMAQSARVLCSPSQTVLLPNSQAGCNMADMADDSAVETAMAELAAMAGARRVVPITYVNSSAAIKAITGRAGGACCTSSNARRVFEWALRPADQNGAGADIVLAIPDRHLGLNTAVAMGYSPADALLYDPALPAGGLTAVALQRARFVLWNGQCWVHQVFKVEHIESVRRRHGGIRVIVHPECPREVVAAADASGSTEQIIAEVTAAPAGSQFAIGTEATLVNRLARQFPDKFIRVLSDTQPVCYMMARVRMPHLLWVLENLVAGEVVGAVTVPQAVVGDARLALERMVSL